MIRPGDVGIYVLENAEHWNTLWGTISMVMDVRLKCFAVSCELWQLARGAMKTYRVAMDFAAVTVWVESST